MNDDWMATLHPQKRAEIDRELADRAQIAELMASIAPELVTISERLHPFGWLALDHLAYPLLDAVHQVAAERGLATRADVTAFLGGGSPAPARSPETAVYLAFDPAHRLLYIGITNSPSTRMRGHAHTAEWWPEMQTVHFVWCDSREEAEATERELVTALRPPFNVVMNPEALR